MARLARGGASTVTGMMMGGVRAVTLSVSHSVRPLLCSIVFPHAPVGLHFVTQRFQIDVDALVRPEQDDAKSRAFDRGLVEALGRAVDSCCPTRDVDISIAGSGAEGDHRLPIVEHVEIDDAAVEGGGTGGVAADASRRWITVVVKVRDEGTARLVSDKVLKGFETDLPAASAALETRIHAASAPRVCRGHFGAAAIQAAFDAVRITFVGPKGQSSKLEGAALRILDLRLRPEVLHNFLVLRAVLHGTPPPPDIVKIQRLLKGYDTRNPLQYPKELAKRT